MSKYPEEVITSGKKGNKEVRLLVNTGRFVRYQYMDPDSGKIVEKGKFSLVLKNEKGEEEHLYIIPLQNKKGLVVWQSQEKKERKLWSKEKGMAVELF